MQISAKTLEEYHKKYPARPGDTVEMFYKFEKFCAQDPCPTGKGYLAWYKRLSQYMESI